MEALNEVMARLAAFDAEEVYERDAWHRAREAREVQTMIKNRREKARLRAVGPVVHSRECRDNPTPFCTCSTTH